MAINQDKNRKFREKLKDTYRITIVDVEDLKEVGNYLMSMRKIYMWLIGIFAFTTLLIVSLIALTPLKRLMPGYGDIEENRQFIELRKKVNELNETLETQMIYTQGLQNMLSGNGITEQPKPNSTSDVVRDTIKNHILTSEDINESKFTQALDNSYFIPPVQGSVSAHFDKSIRHFGVDILAPSMSPIKAIAPGVIINSDFSIEYGNMLSIQHVDNVVSVYKHNSSLLKKTGDRVSAGEVVAIIGDTGTMSDGPHLHFELWYDGNPVNPINFISFN